MYRCDIRTAWCRDNPESNNPIETELASARPSEVGEVEGERWTERVREGYCQPLALGDPTRPQCDDDMMS